ncbi:VC2046/SO_2500 family protein [Shewanella litorisediminis]|uniref:QueD-like protein n=1 Tax=Shewanella litorisediminis TaxID=1173586 RepID=A0ABX7G833_9GAMM|nr:VC2046/SO_2500 family protein [Shewanella litorisediminis]MCL2919306.1 queD-like protein [Shewanella litorisediminis]QRH03524.1 queD-like protein [Shewanella litorisediminis]
MQIAAGLVNESQVGDRLARAVEDGRRGDFGLILAMLSQDARDFAEFCLSPNESVEQRLNKQFELPPKQPLIATPGAEDCMDNSGVFRTFGKKAFHLTEALLPEPLVIRGDVPADMLIALSNCSPTVQRRYYSDERPALPSHQHFTDILEAQRALEKLMEHPDSRNLMAMV